MHHTHTQKYLYGPCNHLPSIYIFILAKPEILINYCFLNQMYTVIIQSHGEEILVGIEAPKQQSQ